MILAAGQKILLWLASLRCKQQIFNACQVDGFNLSIIEIVLNRVARAHPQPTIIRPVET